MVAVTGTQHGLPWLAATGLMLGINQRHILEILDWELIYVDRRLAGLSVVKHPAREAVMAMPLTSTVATRVASTINVIVENYMNIV